MRLLVKHQATYHYEAPIASAIQTLRLMPRSYEGLTVLNWQVSSDARRELPSYIDGYGNVTHCHAVNYPHANAAVFVEGEVETTATHGVVRGAPEPLPPLFFLRRTPLTTADAAIEALARDAARQGSVLKQLHALLNAVRDKVDYRLGTTDSATTAAQALAPGARLCQDHALSFTARAGGLAVPARYAAGDFVTGVDSPEG